MQEDGGYVKICLVLTEAIDPIEGPIPVTFTSQNNTALGMAVLEFMSMYHTG